MRSSILTKTQHCIPNFLIDKYMPTHQELVQVQKCIQFELKTMPRNVIHTLGEEKDYLALD